MKYLKTFNENNYLKYNPTLTEDDTDIASTSIWRKILSVLSKTPIGNLNLEDYMNKVIVDVLFQFHTPAEQIEAKAEKIKQRFGAAIEDYYNKK